MIHSTSLLFFTSSSDMSLKFPTFRIHIGISTESGGSTEIESRISQARESLSSNNNIIIT